MWFLILARNVFVFFFDGVMKNLVRFPILYLRTVCPRKSNPCSICVMTVFSAESCKPRSAQELLDERFHFLFQQFFRVSGDYKIIRVSNQVDFGSFLWSSLLREVEGE